MKNRQKGKGRTIKKRKKILPFPCNKARPDQAGLFRRFFAFGFDWIVITMLATCLYVVLTEVRGVLGGEEGIMTQYSKARKEAAEVSLVIGLERDIEETVQEVYLGILKKRLPPNEYKRAKKMSSEQMEVAFPEELADGESEHKVVRSEGTYSFIQEIVVGYAYFVLFFHLSGRTLGKRLFRLKVVDLKGRDRLGWYQSFERAHGYAASTLFATFGFWQVLWNVKGLTMHDKLAETTVIKLPKKKKIKVKRKSSKKKK